MLQAQLPSSISRRIGTKNDALSTISIYLPHFHTPFIVNFTHW